MGIRQAFWWTPTMVGNGRSEHGPSMPFDESVPTPLEVAQAFTNNCRTSLAIQIHQKMNYDGNLTVRRFVGQRQGFTTSSRTQPGPRSGERWSKANRAATLRSPLTELWALSIPHEVGSCSGSRKRSITLTGRPPKKIASTPTAKRIPVVTMSRREVNDEPQT